MLKHRAEPRCQARERAHKHVASVARGSRHGSVSRWRAEIMTKKTKRTARRAMIAGVAAGGLTAVAAGTARAAIIYADNFDGTAGLVSGRSVTTATGLFGGTAGATWTSDAVVGSPNPDALWNASGGTYIGTGTTDASVGTFTT